MALSFDNTNETLFRVPVLNDSTVASACAFNYILPDPVNCPKPGLWIDLLLFILHLLKTDSRVKLLPATSYEFTDRGPNDTSILGMLLNRKADISPPFMALTFSRSRSLRYSNPFFDEAFFYYVYKQQRVNYKRLYLSKLYPKPFLLSGGLLICLMVLRQMVQSIRKWTDRLISLLPQFELRNDMILGLALVVLFGCISSHVVMVFNMPLSMAKKPITNLEDLAAALESREFTAIASGRLFINEILNPIDRAGIAVFDRLP